MFPGRYIGRIILPALVISATFLVVLGFNQDGNQTQPKKSAEISKLLNELCLDIFFNNGGIYFGPVNRCLFWGINPKLYLIALDFQNGNRNIVSDGDALIHLSS